MNQFRLRLITNLNCNFNCDFCYQKKKCNDILSVDEVKRQLSGYDRFERVSIMGGESTLLDNLPEYIAAVAEKCDTVGLTTNGSRFDEDLMLRCKDAGLDEVAFSIPSFKHFEEITGHEINDVLNNLQMAMHHFPRGAVRVNITQNEWNMRNQIDESTGKEISAEIYEMILLFNMKDLFVVICEDIAGNWVMDFEKEMNAELISEKHGYMMYEYLTFFHGAFGFFHDYLKYDDTDIIMTPVGTFMKWSEYCSAVGLELKNED